jgi:hypothetical protein
LNKYKNDVVFSNFKCEAIGCEAGGTQACINGGICGSDLMCICKDGFTGDKCERRNIQM